MHGEIVHEPFGLDALLPGKGCKLGVVADAVQKRVKEDGLAVGASRTVWSGS